MFLLNGIFIVHWSGKSSEIHKKTLGMADDKSGNRHVSFEQVKAMIDFMGQNTEFAKGSLRSLEARATSKKLWGDLTDILNDCRVGTVKSADGWSKYWSDFKNKLKNKSRIQKRQRRGSSLNKSVKPLTKLEKRALVILGPQFEKKLAIKKISYDPPEVKQEDNTDFCRAQNDSNDRISDCEKEPEESGESSNEEYEEDTDLNSNEPFVHSLYPKWLIEVEKKRADAELLRATAEEKRARTSAKNAEAALIQAEALKKLAEAAACQANAIVRIAAVLENRGHTDDVLSVSSVASLPGYPI